MGGKPSTSGRGRTYSSAGEAGPYGGPSGIGVHHGHGGGAGASTSSGGVMSSSSHHSRNRARSLGSVQNGAHGHTLSIPTSNGGAAGAGSPDSDASTPEDSPFPRGFLQASSLPVHLFSFHAGIKCPVCNKFVPPDDIECHLVMCLTKPRISYNEDILREDKGECVICLDDLQQGDTIARLPCLCIYHKGCIEAWFRVNRSCPEHPTD